MRNRICTLIKLDLFYTYYKSLVATGKEVYFVSSFKEITCFSPNILKKDFEGKFSVTIQRLKQRCFGEPMALSGKERIG